MRSAFYIAVFLLVSAMTFGAIVPVYRGVQIPDTPLLFTEIPPSTKHLGTQLALEILVIDDDDGTDAGDEGEDYSGDYDSDSGSDEDDYNYEYDGGGEDEEENSDFYFGF